MTKRKIRYFEITMLLVFILQNGYLKNRPTLLLLIPIFIGIWQSEWKIKKINKDECLVMLYGLYLMSVTMLNVQNIYDPNNIINIFIQYILIFISVHICYRKIDANSFFISYRNIGIVLAILCIFEQIFRIHFFDILLGKGGMYSGYYYRVSSIFGHPILCGIFLVVLLLVLLYYPFKNIYIQSWGYIVTVFALLFTQTRSAWIAAVICLIIFWLKKRNAIGLQIHKKTLLMIFIFVLFGVVIFIIGRTYINSLYITVLNRISGSLNAGEGEIVRIENIINSFKYWLDRNELKMVFGSGKNSGLLFMKENPISKFGGAFIWDSAIDNQYITIIHESGLVGLIIYILIVWKNIVRLFKTKNNIETLICLSLLCINIVMFFFEGFNYVSIVLFAMTLYSMNSNNNWSEYNKGGV